MLFFLKSEDRFERTSEIVLYQFFVTRYYSAASKRQKTMTEGIIQLLKVAREIWKRDKEVVRSTQQEDREFRSMFGVGAITAITAYNMLIVNSLMPSGGSMMHFLWALIFFEGIRNGRNNVQIGWS